MAAAGASVLSLLAVAAVASAGVAALLLTRHRLAAGLAAATGGGALLLASVVPSRSSPRRDRLATLVADRVFDASVLAPVAWVWRQTSPRVAALALFALGVSFVASYERARGQALGFRGSESVGYRAVRVALLALGLLTGAVEAFLWPFLVVAGAALAVRWWNVQRQVHAA